jgi:hypothetical protein
MPRTWTEAEITDLIDAEICATRIDYRNRFGRAPDAHELAENIYGKLNDEALIQHTP